MVMTRRALVVVLAGLCWTGSASALDRQNTSKHEATLKNLSEAKQRQDKTFDRLKTRFNSDKLLNAGRRPWGKLYYGLSDLKRLGVERDTLRAKALGDTLVSRLNAWRAIRAARKFDRKADGLEIAIIDLEQGLKSRH
jgi:hypothetical protein